jgi:hypothetical protein
MRCFMPVRPNHKRYHLPPWKRYRDNKSNPNDVKKKEFKCNPNTSTDRTVVTLSDDDTTNSRVMLLACFRMKDMARPTYIYKSTSIIKIIFPSQEWRSSMFLYLSLADQANICWIFEAPLIRELLLFFCVCSCHNT